MNAYGRFFNAIMKERQRRFIDAYIQTANATEAARRAGYKSPTVTAAKMLTKANIRAEVNRRLNELKTASTADTQEILEHLTSVLRGELSEEIVTNSGKLLTVKVSERDRLKAAEMLLKVNGAFREKVDVKVDVCAQFAAAVEQVWRNVDAGN